MDAFTPTTDVLPAELAEHGHLHRTFGLLQAVALNMSNMIGVGPFITIPLMLTAMGGPQALLGWIVGLVLVMADGLVWSELGAAFPGSGGSFLYLLEGFGRARLGRLMAFLFIWQFIVSGPLEIASGIIGFSNYTGYLVRMTPNQTKLLSVGVGMLAVATLYRKITSIGRLTVALWVGTLVVVAWVILAGAMNFDSHLAFDYPQGAFALTPPFFSGLGAASLLAVYCYLGYYGVCYIGSEVRDPGRVIPRSIIYSLVVVGAIYLLIYLAIIGVLPWRTEVGSTFIVSDFMEKLYGTRVASVATLLIMWSGFASIFALMLAYSRVPYAAAKEGYFFKVFARLHPVKDFPHVSLLAVGTASVLASLVDLSQVITALLTTRILVQFIGQIFAVVLLRRNRPDLRRPFRMWLYPLPCGIALAGWAYMLLTSGALFILIGLLMLVAGIVAFYVWQRLQRVEASA